jgi:hypothetical protein
MRFMEYNAARSIPILFLVEYRVPYDIGIPEEICIQVEFQFCGTRPRYFLI